MGTKWIHRLSDIDVENKTATCAECGVETPIFLRKAKNLWACKIARDSWKPPSGKFRSNSETEARRKRAKMELNEFLGFCEICRKFLDTPCIDHDHSSGALRGYLCRKCNTGLGMFDDNSEYLKSAIDYLENTKGR